MYSPLIHEEALRNLNFLNYKLFNISDEAYENIFLKVIAVISIFFLEKTSSKLGFAYIYTIHNQMPLGVL